MKWTVTVAKPALKGVARFPAKDQEKILAAMRGMADDPFRGDVVKLEGGGNRWRRRGQLSHLLRRGHCKQRGGCQRNRPSLIHHLLNGAPGSNFTRAIDPYCHSQLSEACHGTHEGHRRKRRQYQNRPIRAVKRYAGSNAICSHASGRGA